jgi:hypothetical protein
MTDAEVRTGISVIIDRRLPAGHRDVLRLYDSLVASRGLNCGHHFYTIHQLGSRGGSPAELNAAIDVLVQSHPVKREPPIIASLHGIFTTGAWQKRLAPIVTRAHMVPEPFDYGFLLPLFFVCSWIRARRIEKFFSDYTEVRRLHPNAPMSICAHSFGTYIVGYAMLKYEQIEFDQIILCGSILPVDFPWDGFIGAGRVRRVLNEFGGQDVWAKWVSGWVGDAGPSGYQGFTSKMPDFFQRHYPRYGHSDFFHPLQFERNWLPFLQGAVPTDKQITYSPPANKPIFLILAMVLIIGLLVWWIGPMVWRLVFKNG